MRAPLCVVIPTLNAARNLPGALACLISGLEAGVIRELIISDGGSSDTTCEIAHDAGASVVTGPAGRGGQLRRGADATSGEWILFLHADTHLPDNWPEIVREHMTKSDNAACFRLAFRAKGIGPKITAAWANVRSGFGLPYGDQGLLISRELYSEIGGYPEIALMEDVAIAKALRGRIERLPAYVTTSPDRFVHNGWFRQGTRNLLTLARYLMGADPAQLAKTYDRTQD